jgi:ABC-type amino acid transport substrate-binding protein
MMQPLLKGTLGLLFLVGTSCEHASWEKKQQSGQIDTASIDSTRSPILTTEEEMGIGTPQFGDLDSMIARRRIRALVPYTPTHYYIDGKKRKGVAYEYLNLLEISLNKRLCFHPSRVRVVFIPVSRAQILPMLQNGYADVAMAGISFTPDRERLVDFSIPYVSELKEIPVGGPGVFALHKLADLAGQTVFVPKGSSYEASLRTLSDSLKRTGHRPIQIEFIPPYLEVEDILSMVQSNLIPFTIITEDMARHWSTVLDSLTLYPTLALRKHVSIGLAFRKNSPQFKSQLDQFVRENRKGTRTGNILYNRYLIQKSPLRNAHSPKALAQLKSYKSFCRNMERNMSWIGCYWRH